MHVLTLVDIETALIRFVGDGETYLGTYHHLVAAHVVVHYVFQGRLKSFWVNQVEVDLRGRCDLDPDVATDEVDETADFQDIK